MKSFAHLKPYNDMLPPGQSVEEMEEARARRAQQEMLERRQREEREKLETITVKELRDWLMLLPDRCNDMPIKIKDVGPDRDGDVYSVKGISVTDDEVVFDDAPVVVTEEIRYGKFGPVKD